MLRAIGFCALILAVSSASYADVIGINLTDDGDGAVDCTSSWLPAPTDPSTDAVVSINGVQYWGPGHVAGTIETDTAVDPTIRITNDLDNDTSFTWTGYTVHVILSRAFTISELTLRSPTTDWTGEVTQPTLTDITVDGQLLQDVYVGSLEMSAGTPVTVGGTLSFSYKITFEGATSYCFTQQMIPTPEPATAGVLAVGALALLLRRRCARG